MQNKRVRKRIDNEDSEQMIKSWGKQLETICSIFLPSHGTANTRSLVEYDRVGGGAT